MENQNQSTNEPVADIQSVENGVRKNVLIMVLGVLVVILTIALVISWQIFLTATEEESGVANDEIEVTDDHDDRLVNDDTSEIDQELEPVNWEELLPEVQVLLEEQLSDITVAAHRPISFRERVDITGNGTAEALVDLGVGGAARDAHTLISFQDGQPQLVRFQEPDGSLDTKVFLIGGTAGGGKGVEMLPEEKAIYFTEFWFSETNPGSYDQCEITAYRWDEQIKAFGYDPDLISKLEVQLCDGR